MFTIAEEPRAGVNEDRFFTRRYVVSIERLGYARDIQRRMIGDTQFAATGI